MTRDAYREKVVGKLNAAAESAGRKVVRPEDLRPGDRVRSVAVGTVTQVELNPHSGLPTITTTGDSLTFELIERPELRLGSVWVDPFDGAKLVALRHGKFAAASGHTIYDPAVDWTPDVIARLVPAEGEA